MFQHNDLQRYSNAETHHFNAKQVQEMIFQADLHLAQRGFSGIALIPLLFFIACYITGFSSDYSDIFLRFALFMILFCCGRVHSVLKIRNPEISSRVFWQRYYFLASLGTGLCWGLLGATVLYYYGTTWSNVMVLYMIAGIGGGAISSYSNWLHLNLWYLVMLFGPVAGVSFYCCEGTSVMIGVLSIFSLIYNGAQAKLWSSVYWNSLMNVFLLDSEVKAHEKAQVMLRDEIAERRLAQESLVLAKEDAEKANNAKTEFLANMSHEMRTPMHAMLGFANMGRNRFRKVPRERLGEYFSLIHESGERLLRLLSDLLDLSTLEVDKSRYDIQAHDLNTSVAVIIAEVQFKLREKHIILVFEESGPKVACFDRQKIIQVLHNLLDNAVRYSQEHSEIRITIEEKSGTGEKTFQQITVKDQGVGLPDAECLAIFDKFRQSSRTKSGAGGTGLGLAICQGIVNAHSGTIWAVNNLDGGASFSFTLPMP
jgi:signal transduction histidine kinase